MDDFMSAFFTQILNPLWHSGYICMWFDGGLETPAATLAGFSKNSYGEPGEDVNRAWCGCCYLKFQFIWLHTVCCGTGNFYPPEHSWCSLGYQGIPDSSHPLAKLMLLCCPCWEKGFPSFQPAADVSVGLSDGTTALRDLTETPLVAALHLHPRCFHFRTHTVPSVQGLSLYKSWCLYFSQPSILSKMGQFYSTGFPSGPSLLRSCFPGCLGCYSFVSLEIVTCGVLSSASISPSK